MSPVVAEIVGVEKALVHSNLKITEMDLNRVIGKDHPPARIDTVVLAMDDEAMEMGVSPSRDQLHNIMEIGNGAVAADNEASPNHGTNAAYPHAKLIRCFCGTCSAH